MDLRTEVGSVALRAPVMTASGTAGHGAEFANYLDPASLGAVVVKSMKADEWAGNPAPRVHPTASGMINSVGLQGKGVPHWLEHDLPDLLATGAAVVASIWGSSVDDYARAAAALAEAPEGVVAVEVWKWLPQCAIDLLVEVKRSEPVAHIPVRLVASAA